MPIVRPQPRIPAHQVMFVRIPRCASWTIMRALRQQKLRAGHYPAIQLRGIVGREVWDQSLTLAVYRNPWVRVLSWYHHHANQKLPEYALPFRDWVLSGMPHHWDHADPFDMLSWVEDEHGRRIVQHVYPLERIGDWWPVLAERIVVQPKLSAGNMSGRPVEWRREYDVQTSDMVYERCQRDIETFGYSFEEEAPLCPSPSTR